MAAVIHRHSIISGRALRPHFCSPTLVASIIAAIKAARGVNIRRPSASVTHTHSTAEMAAASRAVHSSTCPVASAAAAAHQYGSGVLTSLGRPL